jgi:hypothetical protein
MLTPAAIVLFRDNNAVTTLTTFSPHLNLLKQKRRLAAASLLSDGLI